MTKILITGANGYVGTRVLNDLAQQEIYELLGTYHYLPWPDLVQMDITKADEVYTVVENFDPDLIVHLSGNASVKLVENNPNEARAIDVEGSANLVNTANKMGSKILYVSSMGKYTDTLYGNLKDEAESIIKWTKVWWNIVRAGVIVWLSPNTRNDRPYNRILHMISDRRPTPFPDGFSFQPTYIGQIAQIINNALSENKRWYELEPGTPEHVSMYTLAYDLAGMFGLEIWKTPAVPNQIMPPPLHANIQSMVDFGLQNYSYAELLQKLREEIINLSC